MSGIAKTKLKGARDAIAKKDYEKARDAAQQALEYDPENYLAYVNHSDGQQLLAWQGLGQLYEETKNWDEYLKILNKLAELYTIGNEATKCAETIQKIIDIRRNADPSAPIELAEALTLLLPESPFYATLSLLPPPDPTNPTSTPTFVAQSAIHNSLPVLEELVSIYEKHEQGVQRDEISKRRTRLNAPPLEQIRRDVALEILSTSQLPRLYNEVLNHPNASDELRRETEAKLLDLKQRHLFALPASEKTAEKARLASELDELINGMVLLKIPNELAWTLLIEGKDAAEIGWFPASLCVPVLF
uniref:Uncharacterized protein n=1 Tax=Ganoderma boninense TaxID=34458 RepID=A0A5K1K7W9_9APHY|nr:Uncharacterized protein [Ganoderma boninense]